LKKLGLIILLLFGFCQVRADCADGLDTSFPLVESITVDAAGNVTICWQHVTDPDGIIRYVIYSVNPNNPLVSDSVGVEIGTVNCFTLPAGHPINNSSFEPVELSVAAVDSCEKASLTDANRHHTILLKDTFDVCSSSILLEWNAYDDFNSGVVGVIYDIYVNINGGGFNLYASTTSLDTVYSNVIQGDNYEFYIDGIEGVIINPLNSNSNYILTNTSAALVVPTNHYLFTTNVVDSTQITIQFNVDILADITSYRIKRSTSLNGNYVTVGSVSASSNLSPIFTDDNGIKANNTAYYYKVFPINICGAEGDPVNYGSTILVNVESSQLDATNTISFTAYEDWENGVDRYELFRAVAGVWESGSIQTFSSFTGTLVYEDDITKAFYGDGEFCYKVIAFENPGLHLDGSIPASSLSNEACALHEPILFIPNAFTPNGSYNPEFKPVLTFTDPASYFFQIYNKWGEVIFETKDVNQSWNGTFNNSGSDCPQDIYIYLIEFISADGEEYSKRGKITLLR
jgi:gliding motility-associated-like protein